MTDLYFKLPKTSFQIHKIKLKIESQYLSLYNLLHFNNGFFLKEKERIKSEKATELAKLYEQFKGEDRAFISAKESAIADKYNLENEVLFYTEEDFYHAAFILAFSYFESLVTAMCKATESNVQKNVDKLITDSGQTLSNVEQMVYDYVMGDLKNVRNYLTHNYNVIDPDKKIKQREALKREEAKGIGLKVNPYDQSVSISIEYVEQTLDAVYYILVKLANMIGLK